MTKHEYISFGYLSGIKCHLLGLYNIDHTDNEKVNPITVEIVGVNLREVEIHEIGRTITEHYEICDCFPILRPLSDLTIEIEDNGEKFIPIVELLKIEQSSGLKYATINHKVIKIDVHENSEGNTYQLEYSEPYSNMDDGLIQFSYSERFRRFGKVMFKPYKQPLGIGFQLDMFQKLIEWNFDIAGLIKKKEAVDYHTLPDFLF